MLGFGGCPFAEDDLVGNIATETVLEWLPENGVDLEIDREALALAMQMAHGVFTHGE